MFIKHKLYKKDFDNFLCRTENIKINEHTETAIEIVMETEKETEIENFRRDVDKNSAHDKDMDDRTHDVNTDTSVLPTPYVNEIHTNNMVNKYVQKLAPDIQMNDTSLRDKNEELNTPLIFKNFENKDYKD